jgi:hypothetical protein
MKTLFVPYLTVLDVVLVDTIKAKQLNIYLINNIWIHPPPDLGEDNSVAIIEVNTTGYKYKELKLA